MKKSTCLLPTLFIALIMFTSCSTKPKPEVAAAPQPTPAELVKRGEYLVTIMGCNDCHSPKSMGPQGPQIIPELMLSGYPADRPQLKVENSALKEGWVLLVGDLTSAAGPWGVSFAANLTSDPTGIGSWTEENFKRSLKEGKFKGMPGSRTLLPPMPWQNFANISDEDVSAIFAYLKSTNPVRNVVPSAIPPNQVK
jgi:mono/diheme cytochrome c family protein